LHTRRQWAAVKARCWFEEEPRVDFIRNIAPWDADDLDADRSRGLRLDSERPLIKVLLTAAFGRYESVVNSSGTNCQITVFASNLDSKT
jgi:hypothetical protein